MANPTLTRRWLREIDRRAIEEYGMSGLVLMENAARGAIEVLLGCDSARESTLFRGAKGDNEALFRGAKGDKVAIACGKGNNAGDGFAMARLLDAVRMPVKVLLWSEPAELQGDAAANFAILAKCGVPIVVYGKRYDAQSLDAELAGCTWIVDALLGTGSSGDPRPPLDQVIEHLNRHPAQRLAVDLPSGLDCDTGYAAPSTIRADHTVTFVAPKPGLLVPEAKAYVGQLHVVDIGAPRVLVEDIFRLAAEAR